MKTNKFIIILLCLFLNTVLYAQQTANPKIDSLERWIEKYPKKDTIWVKNLIELENLYYIQLPNKYGKFSEDIIGSAKKNNYSLGIARGLAIKANKQIILGKYKEAIGLVYQKMKYDKNNKDEIELANSYSILAYANIFSDRKDDALRYYKISYDLLSKKKQKGEQIVSVLTNIGNLYSEKGDELKAIEYYLVAQDKLYKRIQKNEKYYFQEIGIKMNIGNSYYYLGRYKKATSYINSAIDLILLHKINVGLAYAYLTLFQIYIASNDLEIATNIEVVLEELHKKRRLNANEVSSYYTSAILLNRKKKNFEKSLDKMQSLTIHLDSLKGIEQQKAIQELSVQYETEQKEAKIKDLQQAEELTKNKNKYFLMLTILLSLLLGVACIAIWQVRKATKLRDSLFSVVTHDLRSPVASLRRITSKIDFVLKKNDPKATKLLSTAIEDSATSLYNLVDNLLHWLLIQQGKIKYNPTRFILTHEVREVIQSLQYKANLKNINLEFKEDTEIEIEVDRMFVQTILRNLLDNALKFTPENGTISIRIETLSNHIDIYVSDTGSGINQEIKTILFKEAISKKPTDDKGKGVGLYLCAELAKASASSLKLLSSTSAGSIFVYSLPLNK